MDVSTSQWVTVSTLTFGGVLLSSGSGTGGGAIYMSLFLLTFGDPHVAVPISKVTILGLAVASFLVNVNKRHPKADKHLIDYEVAALLEPPTLIGAIMGVYFNLALPSKILVSALVTVLTVTAAKTFQTGLTKYKQEEAAAHFNSAAAIAPSANRNSPNSGELATGLLSGSGAPFLSSSNESSPPVKVHYRTPLSVSNNTERLRSPLSMNTVTVSEASCQGGRSGGSSLRNASGGPRVVSEPCRGWSTDSVMDSSAMEVEDGLLLSPHGGQQLYGSRNSIMYLLAVWSWNFVVVTFVGGPQAVLCGALWQRVVMWCHLVFMTCLVAGYCYKLRIMKTAREAAGIHEPSSDEGGYTWVTTPSLILYPIVAFLAGVCAGAVGIGGGLLKGPLMMYMGMAPISAVATALYMILFTSTTTTLSYALSGRLDLYISIWFFFLAMIGSAVGVSIVHWALRKRNRPSYLTFFLSLVIFTSTCCLVFSIFLDRKNGFDRKHLTIQDACEYMNDHGFADYLNEYVNNNVIIK